jgi:hypothetical protein
VDRAEERLFAIVDCPIIFRVGAVDAVGYVEVNNLYLRAECGKSTAIFFAADGGRVAEINSGRGRSLPALVGRPGKCGQPVSFGRASCKEGDHRYRPSGLRLFEDHPAAAQDNVVQVWGEVDVLDWRPRESATGYEFTHRQAAYNPACWSRSA